MVLMRVGKFALNAFEKLHVLLTTFVPNTSMCQPANFYHAKCEEVLYEVMLSLIGVLLKQFYHKQG